MGNSFDYVWRVLWSYRCGAVEAGLDLASVDEDLWEYRLNEGSTSSQTYASMMKRRDRALDYIDGMINAAFDFGRKVERMGLSDWP